MATSSPTFTEFRRYVFFGFIGVVGLAATTWAVTDGPLRRSLEDNFFSEGLIKWAIYPRSRHDVYSQRKLRHVTGIPRVTLPIIYEPDVHTWNLAIQRRDAEERARMAAMAPPPPPMPAPAPGPEALGMPPMVPQPPGAVSLSPMPAPAAPGLVGPMAPMPELPADANARMAGILHRARQRQITSGSQSRIDSIKQRLINHMQSGAPTPGITGTPNPPELVPVLPGRQPKGRAGMSYDSTYQP